MARNLPKILQNGLVMWLDGNGKDLSGSGNNGTPTNSPTKTRVLQNDGLSYNGSSQYTTIPDANSLDFGTGEVTISAWTYNTSVSSIYKAIMNKRVGTSGAQFNFQVANPGTIMGFGIYGGSTWQSVSSASGAVIQNKWQLWTATRSGTLMNLYLNGVQIATSTSTAQNGDTTAALEIGKNTDASPGYWPGMIINPMLWNRALSAKEIQLLHKSTFIK